MAAKFAAGSFVALYWRAARGHELPVDARQYRVLEGLLPVSEMKIEYCRH
jgi:hypothetical protein